MYCPKCGNENGNDAKFCSYCGAPLEAPSNYETTETNYGGNWQGGSSYQGDGSWQGGSSSPGYGSGPSGGGGQNVLIMALRVASLIGAVLFALSVLPCIGSIFTTLGYLIEGWLSPVLVLFNLLTTLLLMVSRGIMALALAVVGLCYSEERNNGEPLLMTLGLAGALVAVLAILLPIFGGLVNFISYGDFYVYFGNVPARIGCALAAVIVPVGLIFLSGQQPFVGKSADELLAELNELPATLLAELERFQADRQQRGQSRPNQGQYAAGSGQYSRPEAQNSYGPRRMDDNRGLLKYILLTIVTCGIYAWYVYYTMARDINEICEGDGERTPGLAKYIIFTILTCGIYNFVWHYKFLRRIQRNAPRYGFQVQSLGGMELNVCWLVLMAVGILGAACFIGLIAVFYAMYLVFRNMNLLASAYNERVYGR